MKDSEFIELLNLYLDHEISAAEAARLEAEVQNNPARRKIYEQYCRMQKACKVLASEFVTAEEKAAAPADQKVVAFNVAAAEVAAARRKRAGNFYTIGTIAAAAACVAIVFIGRGRQSQQQGEAVAAVEVSQATQSVASAAVETNAPAAKGIAVAAAPAPSGPRPLGVPPRENTTLVNDSLSLSGKARAEAVLAAATEQANQQLAWIGALQLAPIQQPAPVAELRFEPTPATLRPDGRPLGNRAIENVNVEMSAFQFRR